MTTPNAGGTVTIAPDEKSVLYTPQAGKFGPYTETFTYTMTDGQFSDTATVTVNVEPVVRPRARDDKYTVSEDSTNNALDGSGPTTCSMRAPPEPVRDHVTAAPWHGHGRQQGTTDLDDTIVYTPNADYFGPDTLEYQVDDDYVENGNRERASAATVTITVTNVNDNPDGERRQRFPADPGRQLLITRWTCWRTTRSCPMSMKR